MSVPSLGVMKRAKGALRDAATQTIIAIMLTIGFVLVMILGGLGIMTIESFDAVMGEYRIIYAIVVGFYFAVNVIKNGKTPETSDRTLELIMNMLSEWQITAAQTESEVIKQGKTLQDVTNTQERLIGILNTIAIRSAEKEKESEAPAPKEPSEPEDPSKEFD